MSESALLAVVKTDLRTFFCIGILLLSTILSGCSGMGPGNPNSNMVADREIINAGESVNFDARTSTTPEPTIIDEFRWNFGDGNTKITKQGIVNHIYIQAGTFEVEVTVVNDEGASDSTTLRIFVNSPPQIEIEIPDYIKTGESAILDATDSFDPEGAPIEHFWDFDINVDDDGDGDPTNDKNSEGPVTEIILIDVGNHSGALTVVDDNGASSILIWSIRVISRNFRVVWEEEIIEFDWNGYLEEEESEIIEHIPGPNSRIIEFTATLTLARDIFLPEDNFSLGINIPESGWSSTVITVHENITKNASAQIEKGDMNNIPESGYTVSASSATELEDSLLNEPGERFGQGNWKWTVTAVECDPDIPIDEIDPDQGNDWQLNVVLTRLTLRISEVSS